MNLSISIAIATRNRAHYLKDLLCSIYRQLRTSRVNTEVVVVDDGSTDSTEEIVRPFSDLQPLCVKYHKEKGVGLAAARNAAALLSEGTFVAFVDDDVLLADGWLEAMHQLIQRTPQCVVAGGKIHVQWPEGKDPNWLPRRLLWVYGHLDYGTKARPLKAGEVVNGGNVMFRREVFLEHGGFDSALGHRPGRVGGAEEQELLTRLRRLYPAGCYYVGNAKVVHRISPEKANRSWALHRLYGASRDRASVLRKHRPEVELILRQWCCKLLLGTLGHFPPGEFVAAECRGFLDGFSAACESRAGENQ